jgi:hypothetical protein
MMNIPADGIIISPAKIGAGLASLVSGVFTATAVKADTGVIAVQPLSLAGATTQALDAPASMRVDVTHCTLSSSAACSNGSHCHRACCSFGPCGN